MEIVEEEQAEDLENVLQIQSCKFSKMSLNLWDFNVQRKIDMNW